LPTWRPSAEDITDVLTAQNPWHLSGAVPDVLAPPVERALAQTLWRTLRADGFRQYPLILGPRRVGKTTTMYQTVRHLLDEGVDRGALYWFRLDHPLLLDIPLDRLIQVVIEVASSTTPPVVFLDELVYARDWDLWLKTFYDERWPVRIVATSSATAALARRRTESGVGRWTEQYLPPYSFAEFLDLMDAAPDVTTSSSLGATLESLEPQPLSGEIDVLRRRFLLVGGFPELLLASGNSDDAGRLLQSQQVLRNDAVERAIYKDIPQSFGLESPLALERLLYVLAGQIGGVLSPTRIGGELGLSQPTFDRYLSYLERAFLVFTLPNYSGSEAAVQRRGRKVYFVDGAVRNAALQRGLAPLTNQVELGILTENLVAANLHALAIRSNVRLYFWRDGQREVDLVFDHPDEPVALEIGLSPEHSRAGLLEFVRRHPRFKNRCWIVAPGAAYRRPQKSETGVGTIPLDLFLVIVGRLGEQALQRQLGIA